MATVENDRRTWLEVIDPKSGRKVDVTVRLHATLHHGTDVPAVLRQQVDHQHNQAVVGVLNALEQAGFRLSDIEEQGSVL